LLKKVFTAGEKPISRGVAMSATALLRRDDKWRELGGGQIRPESH
jgi:hypothetical protein